MTLGKLQVRGVYAWLLVGGLGLLLLLLLGIQVGGWVLARSLSEPVRVATSPLVVDRQGRLLRAFTVADGRWRLPVTLAEVDPLFLSLLLTFEDRRFYHHGGVDYLALARAVGQLIVNGRVVSGASTLTMQTARLLHGQSSRGVAGKLRQMVQALALERRLDKAAILERYLHLAPYGGNLEGIRAASLAWFGLEPRRLTPAQAALLVALPQAPEARRPDRDPAAARRARDRVLARALAAGILDAETVAAAQREPVPRQRLPFPLLAPHATQRARLAHPERPVQRLTLAADLQARLETLAAERGRLLGEKLSLALLVADHPSGEILAAVGSPGLETAREGFIDMTRVVRSPGSTLKPLIYGLAFEAGIAHPESLIEDRPAGFGRYVPANFDRDYQGTVTLRRALQLSLNIPAVKLLEAVGPARLVARLKRAGARPELPDLSPPGLAIGLGGVGLRLTDLVAVYGAIARGGRPMPLVEELPMVTDGGADGAGSAPSEGAGVKAQAFPGDDRLRLPVLDERAAWQVTDILAAAPPPEAANTAGLAFKTGTSYGYRDAWAVGYDGATTIAVWVGRPDGAAVPGVVGRLAAAPILFEAFQRLGPARKPLPPAPPGTVIARTGELPAALQRFRPNALPQVASASEGDAPPAIAFPPDGARIDLDGEDAPALSLKVYGGTPPFTWLADGVPITQGEFRRDTFWEAPSSGFARLSVIDAKGKTATARVRVE